MLAKNLNELVVAVRNKASVQGSYTLSDDQIKDSINYRYKELLSREDWPFLVQKITVNVNNGQSVYALPSNVRKVLSVQDRSGRTPHFLRERADMAEDVFLNNPSSFLEDFVLSRSGNATTITIYPTPKEATTLYVEVVVNPAELEDNDYPIFREDYHITLVFGAAAEVLSQEADDTKRKADFNEEYNAGYLRMMDDYFSRGASRPFQYGGRTRARRNTWSS